MRVESPRLACYAMSVMPPAAPGRRAFESWGPLAAALAWQLLGGGLDAAPWELPTAGVFLHGGRVGAGGAVVCFMAWRHFGAGPHFAVGRLLGLLIRPRRILAESSGCTAVICQRSRYTCSGWLQHYASTPWPAVFGQGWTGPADPHHRLTRAPVRATMLVLA